MRILMKFLSESHFLISVKQHSRCVRSVLSEMARSYNSGTRKRSVAVIFKMKEKCRTWFCCLQRHIAVAVVLIAVNVSCLVLSF